MDKLGVILIEVGVNPRHVELDHSLATFQSTVGGPIEVVPVGDHLVLVVNEEGKLHGLQPNFIYAGDTIVGNAFVCRIDDEGEFASVTEDDLTFLRILFGREG